MNYRNTIHCSLCFAGKCVFIFMVLILGVLGCKKEPEGAQVPGNNLSVGASARELLSDVRYRKLVVHIMYMENHAPTSSSVENMVGFLNSRVKKPSGIQLIQTQIPAGNQSMYSVNDIRNIEGEHRQAYNQPGIMAISLIFLDGEYAGNSGDAKVLGIAYLNTSMAIFESTVKENSGGLLQPSRTMLETTIIHHEIGHILGLVNLGSDMVNNHEDSQHGHHCENSNCLMYYAVETTDVINNLLENGIPDLDQNCKLDLKANGGK